MWLAIAALQSEMASGTHAIPTCCDVRMVSRMQSSPADSSQKQLHTTCGIRCRGEGARQREGGCVASRALCRHAVPRRAALVPRQVPCHPCGGCAAASALPAGATHPASRPGHVPGRGCGRRVQCGGHHTCARRQRGEALVHARTPHHHHHHHWASQPLRLRSVAAASEAAAWAFDALFSCSLVVGLCRWLWGGLNMRIVVLHPHAYDLLRRLDPCPGPHPFLMAPRGPLLVGAATPWRLPPSLEEPPLAPSPSLSGGQAY